MTREIEFISLQENREVQQFKHAFEFRKDRPYKWLQKFCLEILRRIGAYSCQTSVKYTRVKFNSDTFMENIFKQGDILHQFYNCNPTHLFIGAEDFERFICSEECHTMLAFNTTYNRGREICGLRVIVIPWMRGMVVMSKEALNA